MARRDNLNGSIKDSIFQWDTVIDTLEDCVFLLDANFKIVKTNKSAREFFGKTDEEIIGKHCWRLTHGTTESPDFCPMAKMMKSKKRESMVIELAGRYMRITGDPILDEDGHVKGAIHIIRDIDEIERARRTIIAECEKSQKYLEIINAIVVVLDKKGEVTLINKKGCEILQAKESDIIGKNWFINFIPETKRESVFDVFQQIMDGKLVNTEHYENEVLTTTGEIRLVAWHNSVLRNNAGKIISTISYGEDITAQKQLEETLRDSEEMYRLLVNSSAEIVVVLQDGIIQLINPISTSITGFTEQELMLKPFLSLIHPNDRAMIGERYQKRLRGAGVPKRYDLRLQTKDGNTKWVTISVVTINWKGRPATLNLLTDITERKQVEESLEIKRQQLSAVFDNVADSLFLLSVEPNDRFRFITINKSFLDITGLSKDQVIDKYVHEVIPESSLTLVLGNYNRAIRDKKTVTWKEISDYPKGKKIGEVAITPIFNEDGKCVNMAGSVRDLTEHKREEEKLKKITAEAVESKLKAESYFDFLAHDIANILSPVMAYADIMKSKSNDPAEITKWASRIMEQAQRASSLILNLRRLESIEKMQPNELDVIDLRTLLSAMEDIIQNDFPNKEIAISYDIPDVESMVVRGGEWVEDVLRCIYDNAVRYSTGSSVKLEIRASMFQQENEETGWQIEISDHGPGIADNIKSHIGENMGIKDRKFKGVASSLPFCRSIIKSLGGELSIQDRIPGDRGQGTRIIIMLPKGE